MTKWITYQHKFNYKHICGEDPIRECTHENCTLSFIVKIDPLLASPQVIKEAAVKTMISLSTNITTDKPLVHDFGSLSTDDLLDDSKKLFLTNLPDGEKQVHLLLEKEGELLFWD